MIRTTQLYRTVAVGVLTVSALIVISTAATPLVPRAQSDEETNRYERCTNDDTAVNLATTSKFAPPTSFFGVVGPETTINILCGTHDTAKATVFAGSGYRATYVYKYGYERDVVAKKWRKIKLSGDETNGPWIIGSATAELQYVPKNEDGQVLIYMCDNVHGTWKCGCKDISCTTPHWQRQTYSVTNGEKPLPIKEGTSSLIKPPRPFNDVLEDDYLSIYGARALIVKPGQVVIAEGGGLSGEIEIHFGDVATVECTVLSSTKVQFTVPDIEPGIYTAWFTSDTQRSRNLRFVIPSAKPEPVVIERVEPEVLHAGKPVTLYGTGFTPDNNQIMIGAYKFTELTSADGRSISFSLIPDKLTRDDVPQEILAYISKEQYDYLLSINKMAPIAQEAQLQLQLLNSNGFSNIVTVRYK